MDKKRQGNVEFKEWFNSLQEDEVRAFLELTISVVFDDASPEDVEDWARRVAETGSINMAKIKQDRHHEH
jgi:hypothetical protein